MKWTYKFKSKMDLCDADWARDSGTLGTFDDEKREDMVKVFMHIILLQEIAALFNDGTFDREKALDFFRGTCATTNITEEEVEAFIKEEYLDEELFEFANEFIPQRPDFYCHPHSLSFEFSRIPEVVVEEPVKLNDVDKYVKAKKGH